MTGRGIQLTEYDSGIVIKIGNFKNSHLEGFGIQFQVEDHWDPVQNVPSPREKMKIDS
jgi:hypothetical protein